MPPYIIRVSSQKGGVGKTTVAVNLAVSLQVMGYSTLLVDADTTNPSLGFHLGLEKANAGYRNFVLGKYGGIRDVVSVHAPSGLHVIPGTINYKPFPFTDVIEKKMCSELRKTQYQFIVIDTEPGYTALTSNIDKALIITTPDMPSLSSVIRLAHAFASKGIKHSLVVNKIRNRKFEIHPKEIAQMYDGRIEALLPEDDIVPISVEEQIPAMILDGKNPFISGMKRVSEGYAAGVDAAPETFRRRRTSVLDGIRNFFRLRQ